MLADHLTERYAILISRVGIIQRPLTVPIHHQLNGHNITIFLFKVNLLGFGTLLFS